MAGSATQRARAVARRHGGQLGATRTDVDTLPKKALAGTVRGTMFDWQSSDFIDPETHEVWDGGDQFAREMRAAIAADWKIRQLAEILTSPIKGATWKLVPKKGDTGEAADTEEKLRRDAAGGGMSTPIRLVIAQAASSIVYARAYFAKGFMLDPVKNDGSAMYSELAMRPASTCRLLRSPNGGNPEGFAQDIVWWGPGDQNSQKWDGKPVHFTRQQSLVFVNGQDREPVTGVSDLEVALWCWRTKKKAILLWLSFVQGAALPRTILKHKGDEARARAAAVLIASLGASGVGYLDASQIELDVLDVSGKGAGAITELVKYLDNAAAGSVLAGQLELTSMAAHESRGSNALSEDASKTFYATREHAAAALEETFTNDAIAPLIRHNYGRQAPVPDFKFDPLAGADEGAILALLQALATAPGSVLPSEFIAELAVQAARLLDMDVDKISASVTAAAVDAAKAAASKSAPPAGQTAAAANGAIEKVRGIAKQVAAKPGKPAKAAAGRKARP